jgi:tetratricopeptide (TPR) repeat protein
VDSQVNSDTSGCIHMLGSQPATSIQCCEAAAAAAGGDGSGTDQGRGASPSSSDDDDDGTLVIAVMIALAAACLVGAGLSGWWFRKHASMQVKPISATATMQMQDSIVFGDSNDHHQSEVSAPMATTEVEKLMPSPPLPPVLDAKKLQAQTTAARALKETGDIFGALEQYRAIADDCAAALGLSHPDTLKAQFNLANNLASSAESASYGGSGGGGGGGGVGGGIETNEDYGTEARRLYEAVVTGLLRSLGPQHNDTCKAQKKLAEHLAASGEVIASRKLYGDAIRGWSSNPSLGASHERVLLTQMQLAALLAEVGGSSEKQEARELMEDVLPKLCVRLGDHAADTLKARSQFARFLQTDEDELVAAKSEFLKCLEGWQSHHSGSGSSGSVEDAFIQEVEAETLKVQMALAEVMKEQGDLDGARTILNQVVSRYTKPAAAAAAGHGDSNTGSGGGSSSSESLAAQIVLANLLRQLGETKQAREQYERVVREATRVHGALHEETLTAQTSLARLLKADGRASEAWRLWEQIVGGYTQSFGSSHPKTLKAQMNLAMILKDEADLSDGLKQWARQLFMQVVDGFAARYGSRHKDTLTAQANLANLLHREGDLVEARDLLCNVVEGWTQQLGRKNPRTVRAMKTLAEIEKHLASTAGGGNTAAASAAAGSLQHAPGGGSGGSSPVARLAAMRAKSNAMISRIGSASSSSSSSSSAAAAAAAAGGVEAAEEVISGGKKTDRLAPLETASLPPTSPPVASLLPPPRPPPRPDGISPRPAISTSTTTSALAAAAGAGGTAGGSPVLLPVLTPTMSSSPSPRSRTPPPQPPARPTNSNSSFISTDSMLSGIGSDNINMTAVAPPPRPPPGMGTPPRRRPPPNRHGD